MSPITPAQVPDGRPDPTYRRRPLVVIASSDDAARDSLRLMLESWDLDVAEAASCSDAPEVAGRCHPDLVLLNAAIPFTESLEAAAALRNQPPTSDVPVLVVSEFVQEPFRKAALAQGVADYLTKPCSLDQLRVTVLRLARYQHVPNASTRSHNRPRIRPNSVL